MMCYEYEIVLEKNHRLKVCGYQWGHTWCRMGFLKKTTSFLRSEKQTFTWKSEHINMTHLNPVRSQTKLIHIMLHPPTHPTDGKQPKPLHGKPVTSHQSYVNSILPPHISRSKWLTVYRNRILPNFYPGIGVCKKFSWWPTIIPDPIERPIYIILTLTATTPCVRKQCVHAIVRHILYDRLQVYQTDRKIESCDVDV